MTGTDHQGSDANSSSSPPNHLGTTVPNGQLEGFYDPEKTRDTVSDGQLNGSHDSEKLGYRNQGSAATINGKEEIAVDEEEDADMDALINDLESDDGHADHDEGDEKLEAGGAKPVAEKLLQTSTTHGLTDAEVLNRRRKFGWNQMKEEKKNRFLIFLGFFVGPIQFIMEVSYRADSFPHTLQPRVLSQVYKPHLLQSADRSEAVR